MGSKGGACSVKVLKSHGATEEWLGENISYLLYVGLYQTNGHWKNSHLAEIWPLRVLGGPTEELVLNEKVKLGPVLYLQGQTAHSRQNQPSICSDRFSRSPFSGITQDDNIQAIKVSGWSPWESQDFLQTIHRSWPGRIFRGPLESRWREARFQCDHYPKFTRSWIEYPPRQIAFDLCFQVHGMIQNTWMHLWMELEYNRAYWTTGIAATIGHLSFMASLIVQSGTPRR